MKGKIYVVGMGPGNKDNMSFKAFDSMQKSDILIGQYLNLYQSI